MRTTYFIYFCLLGIFGWSCGETTPSDTQYSTAQVEEEAYKLPGTTAELYQVVLDKHDTTMLMMSPIIATQHQLREKLSEAKGAKKELLLEALSALNKGDEGMRRWMREFKNTDLHEENYRAWSEAEVRAYLEEEERKIEQVDVDMRTSISTGKALLEEL